MSADRSEERFSVMETVRQVWAQAWPTVLTMLSYTLMQFVDSLMVSVLGPEHLAGQGNGGIWSFAPLAFLFGFMTVVNTFVSQSIGAGRHEQVARYGWAGLWLAVGAWLLLMVPWATSLPWVFGAMGHDPAVLAMETSYGQILAYGSIAGLCGKAMSNFFFGIQRPRVITLAALCGNLTNVLLNYVLIYGEDGVPRLGLPGIPGVPALGVSGAAIATVCGIVVETSLPLSLFLGRAMHQRFGTRRQWRPPWGQMRDLLRVGWPAGFQFGNELICWGIFMTVLVGKFGSIHLAAGWSVLRFMHLSFMPAVGFGVATTSLVGRSIGEGRPDLARRRARTAIALATIYMTICGILMGLFRHQMVALFSGGDEVEAAVRAQQISIGGGMMICAAIFQTFDAIGIVYIGALRGAGDTLVPGIVTLIYSWSIIVGGGWAMVALAPKLESLGPWIAASAYIILLGITMAWRFESGRWRSIKLLHPAQSPVP